MAKALKKATVESALESVAAAKAVSKKPTLSVAPPPKASAAPVKPLSQDAIQQQYSMLVEIGSGGLSMVSAYVTKFGHDIPETTLERVRLHWHALALKKAGVMDPTKATAEQAKKANQSARSKLTQIRMAVKGFSSEYSTVAECVMAARGSAQVRAPMTPKARLHSLVKQIAKLEIKQRSPEETKFLAALAEYAASLA